MKYLNFLLSVVCLILIVSLALREPEVRTEVKTEVRTVETFVPPEKPTLPPMPFGYHAQWMGDLIIISAPFGRTTLEGDRMVIISVIRSMNIRVCFFFIDTEADNILPGVPLIPATAFGCTPIIVGTTS